MNILFVLEHYYPYIGGAEKLFTELAIALVREGHSVEIVTTRFDKNLAKKELIRGVRIHRVQCFNRFLFTFFSLPLIIQKAKLADIVHTTSYNAALPAWLGTKPSGKPVIITFHEVWGELWKRLPFTTKFEQWGYYIYEQLILKLQFNRFIAVSEATRQALIGQGIPSARISLIYNGLEYSNFKGYHHAPPPNFTFTYFGRLGISKGLDLLIPAAAKFCHSHPESLFRLIIPKQPARTYRKVMELIEAHQLIGHMEILHNLTKAGLYRKISQSSCVVTPSYSEGFCFVAAEAMAMGVPIISSGKGALKEVVKGKFIEMEAMSVEAILLALEKAQRGDWLVRPARQYTLNEAVQQYLKCYDEMQQI